METYIGACFSSARMASFAFKSYFLRSSSPLVTCTSSRGLPRQKSEYEGVDMMCWSTKSWRKGRSEYRKNTVLSFDKIKLHLI
jgi:hypothetical protein